MNWQVVCLKPITDDLTTLHGLPYTSLTLWLWSWTFTVQHTIYVKCEYFVNQEG